MTSLILNPMFSIMSVFIILLWWILRSDGARILAIIPTPSFSHNTALQPLWRELSLRGHSVTLLTAEPIGDPQLVNLTEVDLSFSYKTMLKNLQEKIYTNRLEMYKFGYLRHAEVCDEQLGHPALQAIIRNESEWFDLLITESSRLPVLAFAHRFRCPSIGVTVLDVYPTMHSLLGDPTHPLVYPDIWLGLGDCTSIVGRIRCVLYDLGTSLLQTRVLFPLYDQMIEKHFGEGYPPIGELVKGISIQFVNTDPVLHKVRPLVPGVIQVGGTLHRLSRDPLRQDLRSVLDKATNGFIYFSLGSYAKSSSLPPKVLEVILETFAEIRYTVLWKFEDVLNKTENVITLKWVPQVDVLGHPNIKLFITHGGLQSINEAIHFGVPMVGMPIFADQQQNVHLIVSRGCGLSANYRNLDRAGFEKTINEVIDNSRYATAIKTLRDRVRDQPMTGLERAVWWTEYVLRHKGAGHLKSGAVDVAFYQYYLLDVLTIVIALFTLIIFGFYFVLASFFRIIRLSCYFLCKN
ncbi:hypothetical protein PPYR_14756 [Photinus pyralis]|uniref:UDP-glucuronosyltransferase n=2 Tax=Photinus pyralis TaxID=7054 RepID=A0A5N4A647_PHOPY|nr:UDP-glucuronosyltransferase 3A2-like [Photinus pyralis]KAB0792797.1 hypothetical protein PPYR_14756 [Photinus pyralis]